MIKTSKRYSELQSKKVKELKILCKGFNIELPFSIKKADIIQLLLNHEAKKLESKSDSLDKVHSDTISSKNKALVIVNDIKDVKKAIKNGKVYSEKFKEQVESEKQLSLDSLLSDLLTFPKDKLHIALQKLGLKETVIDEIKEKQSKEKQDYIEKFLDEHNPQQNLDLDSQSLTPDKRIDALSIADNVQKNLKRIIARSGWILYFFNESNAVLEPLINIQPILHIKNMKEVYLLSKPSFMLKGTPVFIIMREIPYSIELMFTSYYELLIQKGFTKKEIRINIPEKDDKLLLIPKGKSASELEAKTSSIISQRIFRNMIKDPKLSIIFALSIVLTAVITFLFTQQYFNIKGAG